jgi:hypothetical protein
MLSRLFPKQFDNNYRGYALALWLLAPIALMILAQCVVSLVMTRDVLMGPDRIPVDTYDAPAAQTVIALFALAAVYRIVLPLMCLVALVRYRAMVPLMYLLLAAVSVANRVVLFLNPIVRNDAPATGFAITLALLAAILVGLALSLATPAKKRAAEGAPA